ncbi:MFS transporter [Gemmatimonadota bacterium]
MQLDNRKAIFGWTMYDWANSAFATTVMAGFFPIFFGEYWSTGVEKEVTTFRLGLVNSLSCIVVALSAPVLGAIADKGTAKKKFLLFFAFLGLLTTSSLYLVSKGNWPFACILYGFACIGFAGGNIFYDSLIMGVASEKKVDFISALGYSLGYLGGGLLFGLNAWMVIKYQTFGFADEGQAVKFAFLTVGIWWALFSVPIFLFVKESENGKTSPGTGMVKAGLVQLRDTFHEIRHLKTIFLFLVAYWLYIDGVDTIIRMAVDYGNALGFEKKDLIVVLLMIQFIGFPAALAFGYLGGKIGAKRAIFIAIAVYLFICIWGAFIQSKSELYILAVLIALVQGGIQALSRSYYSRIIPAGKSAEYFGFYNMLGKFAAVIGPVLMGGAGLLLGSSRAGIAAVSLLFISGGILLYFVDEKKGREELKYLAK